jgi:putative salt-induced outer membrane protein YdiY
MKTLFLILLVPFTTFAEFNNESEVSVVQTGGNSRLEAYNGKTKNEWKLGKRKITAGGHYTQGASDVEDENTGKVTFQESSRNWDVNFRYSQNLTNKFFALTAYQIEADIFAGIDQRDNYDIGAKYQFYKKDKNDYAILEAGARYSREQRISADNNGQKIFDFTKGRLFSEVSYKNVKGLISKVSLEYLPNFTFPEDYIINYNISVQYAISEVFSLKTAYNNSYDNVPNEVGNVRTDYQLTTALVANF